MLQHGQELENARLARFNYRLAPQFFVDKRRGSIRHSGTMRSAILCLLAFALMPTGSRAQARIFWVALTRWDAIPSRELLSLLAQGRDLVYAKLPKRTKDVLAMPRLREGS